VTSEAIAGEVIAVVAVIAVATIVASSLRENFIGIKVPWGSIIALLMF